MFFLRTRTFLRLSKIVKMGKKGKKIEESLTFGVTHENIIIDYTLLELSRTQQRLNKGSIDKGEYVLGGASPLKV